MRYILVPGWVRSRNDGQMHWISASSLANLYRVPYHQCLVDGPDRKGPEPRGIRLYPRYDGDYTLPAE